MDKLIYGITGAVIGGLIVWAVTADTLNYNNVEETQVSSQMMSNIDAHFIEQMIPHHEDAITMAKLAPEKATHLEIKTLSQNITDSQTKEINQMKTWYQDWYGRELPTGSETMNVHGMMSNTSGMHMGMMGDEMDLESLKNSANFDKSFIEGMIPHHQMAVMMASMLKRGTNRPEMQKLADDIISAQTSEIDQMRQWYSDWGY